MKTVCECIITADQVCDISVERSVVAGDDSPRRAAGKQEIGREFVLRLVSRTNGNLEQS